MRLHVADVHALIVACCWFLLLYTASNGYHLLWKCSAMAVPLRAIRYIFVTCDLAVVELTSEKQNEVGQKYPIQ
jgi:hypothetical protein